MTDHELHCLTARYYRAYRLYKAAILKDERDGYTHGDEVLAASRNWDTMYHTYYVLTGTVPPPPCH